MVVGVSSDTVAGVSGDTVAEDTNDLTMAGREAAVGWSKPRPSRNSEEHEMDFLQSPDARCHVSQATSSHNGT